MITVVPACLTHSGRGISGDHKQNRSLLKLHFIPYHGVTLMLGLCSVVYCCSLHLSSLLGYTQGEQAGQSNYGLPLDQGQNPPWQNQVTFPLSKFGLCGRAVHAYACLVHSAWPRHTAVSLLGKPERAVFFSGGSTAGSLLFHHHPWLFVIQTSCHRNTTI